MKTAFYSTHKFERDFLLQAAGDQHELVLLEPTLSLATAPLAAGCEAVCIFVNDDGSAPVLEKLAALGVKYIALRSAGFNHVDIQAAHALGMRIARVPEYSPYAVAEHTVALILALNRKLVRAHNRIRDLNFSLDGLTGFDLHGKTVGIIGMGKIGKIVGQIMRGFGCRVIAFDRYTDKEWTYVSIEELCRESDIISLHAPLTPETEYIINKQSIAKMKKGVMLINTSRGRLINTLDVTEGLKSGQIGYLGLDVYEEERGLFFEDHSSDIVQDDVISRLITFANVLITSHQAFLTDTALKNIAATTMYNLDCFVKGEKGVNELG